MLRFPTKRAFKSTDEQTPGAGPLTSSTGATRRLRSGIAMLPAEFQASANEFLQVFIFSRYSRQHIKHTFKLENFIILKFSFYIHKV